MLRKLVHKFWSRVLGIPMPQPRIPRLKVGERIDELRIKLQTKIDWDMGWRTREYVDEQMNHLGEAGWWPAKAESFDHINDVEPDPKWEDVL